MPDRLSIREVAARTGISAHTLRYYERIGLVLPIARAASGHRRYGDDDLRWLAFVKRLLASGMTLRVAVAYARLVRRGDATIAARRALLAAHRVHVEEEIARLRETLASVDEKLRRYDGLTP